MKGGLSPVFTYSALGILAVAIGVAALSLVSEPSGTDLSDPLALPAGSTTSSCADTWPGYPLPRPTVVPGENLSCAAIDSFGAALKASCDASCASGGGCTLRTTGHTWNCQEGGADSSRPEAVWLCPRSTWDLCDPRPLSPCEIDGTYCDATCDAGDPKLVQRYRPGQPLNYFGIPAGEARTWTVGDSVKIGRDTLTIECIAIGNDPNGGQTTCGNTKASFDIIVVSEKPSRAYTTGTCVEKL